MVDKDVGIERITLAFALPNDWERKEMVRTAESKYIIYRSTKNPDIEMTYYKEDLAMSDAEFEIRVNERHKEWVKE